MAWEHYTDYLNPGDLITAEQRNELIAAFRERVLTVAGGSGDGLHSTMADVIASNIITDRVRWVFTAFETPDTITRGLGARRGNFENSLESLCQQFAAPDSGDGEYENRFTSATLRSAIAADLGVTASDIYAVWDSSEDSALLWNSIRSGIRLLKAGFRFGTRTNYRKSSGAFSNLADAFDDAISASEADTSPNFSAQINVIRSGGGTSYIVRLTRSEMEIYLHPDLDLTYAVRVRFHQRSGPFAVADDLELSLGAASSSTPVTLPSSGAGIYSLTGLADDGWITLGVRLGSYTSAVLDYDASSDGNRDWRLAQDYWWATDQAVCIEPAYTHP